MDVYSDFEYATFLRSMQMREYPSSDFYIQVCRMNSTTVIFVSVLITIIFIDKVLLDNFYPGAEKFVSTIIINIDINN